MSYQVLAIKYRPQTFDDVVGQPHVTTTLTNAISSDRVAHALLFTGPRGTGKTTIARILARAMNCKKGPTPFPCNTCKICTDIIEGHCTDVFEIDGASNNSVDQIRDLRENVTYMPSSAPYKIYIIDEVHMLSTAAFNALLKTLEEPPDHVMFIFATTEVHKIPITILSRCQRHDLGRISLPLISGHLQMLCSREGFNIEAQSLDLIAQEADGSIRDALSLLDRILSSAKTLKIEHQTVLDGLGILDRQILHDTSAAIFKKNGAQLIEIIENINDSGIDLKKYYSDLIVHFRNLNVIKICGKDSPNAHITDSEKEIFFQATAMLSSSFINTVLQILLDEESMIKYSSHTKIAIEMVLLRLLQINPGAQIDQIISKLDGLANQINSTVSYSDHKFEPVQESAANFLDTKNNDIPVERDIPTANHAPAVREALPVHVYHASQDVEKPQKDAPHEKTWPGFLNRIEQTLPFMFVLLSKGVAQEKNTNEIIVELKDCSSFDKNRLETKKNELKKACKDFLGKDLTIKIVSENKPLTENKKKKEIKARQAAFNHPLVVEAQKMFNGEIINY
ncbi:DNA polymerase III subunit gamma/tau [Desulfobacula toluolica]|uniref:DNA polymerase III subunit gamma/tau n=1 Tax=Desulfobacula toluolica (strain DSM 7467 / Tol2) TaxID=651182 RepID=K0NEZ0_DESTT|nr:DNA polymerase III subunit gamma/tau [Desulfobacula toluolica]CCK79505.1 DnaX: DNA polymerase III, subunit gamma/tau [Desulfobacula toluolica Tol2]